MQEKELHVKVKLNFALSNLKISKSKCQKCKIIKFASKQ